VNAGEKGKAFVPLNIGHWTRCQTVDRVFDAMTVARVTLGDLTKIGGEDLKSTNRRLAEKARHVEKTWPLMAEGGVVYADLEQAAGPTPEKSSRGPRSEGVFSEAIDNKDFLDHGPPKSDIARRGAGAILADPPLAFRTWSHKGEGRSPQHHYACQAFEQLAAMPINNSAAQHCFLFLWVPLRSVFLVEPLMQAWGFTFSGAAFAWVKQNRRGVGWFMGGGYGTRHNIEVCWLGRRGSPQRKSKAVRELIIAPVRQHSRKPDEVYSRIETFCAGPYAELFARQQWPGRTCIGDEFEKFSASALPPPSRPRELSDRRQRS
jgi:N6-adenosine-specific RNA methylase IME4